MPNDVENYMEYQLMGSVTQVMKRGCLPTRFQCQLDRRKITDDTTKPLVFHDEQRKGLIEECEKDSEERTVIKQASEMTEVDKFKRRVIRAVARLLRKDQTPGEEMWKALQNEAGCDCKLLWQRMCALTIKKMRRLLLAEDRLDSIAAVAKMTLTDWLLFDLVLVHEDIDVIGQDLKTEPAILTELFNVVKRFQIEGKQGEELATAWTGATFYYNSFGRQCSPMLLQRRWYQLKKLTRTNFYKFWSQYRGNPRLLATAKDSQPTKLHNDIAQRYPHIITTQFMEWDKMIKDRWVILPEEFEKKLKKRIIEPKQPTTTSTANEPDIVLLEPRIDTIDLLVDSDHEPDAADGDSTDSRSQPLNPVSLAAAIKKEPQDEFEMDFEDDFAARVLETTELPDDSTVNDEDNTTAPVETQDDAVIADKVQEPIRMPMICSVAGNFDESSVDALIAESERERSAAVMDEVNNILISAVGTSERKDSVVTSIEIIDSHKVADEEPVQIESASETQPIELDESDDSAKVSSNQVMTEINEILETAAEVNTKSVGNVQRVKVKIGPKSRVHRPHHDEMPVESDTQVMDVDESDKGYTNGGVMSEINDILESAMQGKTTRKAPLTNVDANAGEIICPGSVKEKQKVLTSDDEDTNTIKVKDLRLGETPLEELVNNIKSGIEASAESAIDPAIDIPTDLTFEDDGIELVDDGIAFEEDNDYEEKKPDIETESGASTLDETEKLDDSPKFDLKLLMHPCVSTIKLEDMAVFKNKSIVEVKDKITLENALVESKIHVKEEPKELNDDQDKESIKSGNRSETDDSSDSEESIPENKKVKLSSYLLQKPKSRSYNPIQLCKNPDFNTRLKRLTVGFLSSGRNRLLLKCLKPMTIDVSKAFESKLINGTVYLKSDDGPKIKCEKPEEVAEEPSVTAVMPSAMPVQSLIDNTTINLQELLPPKSPEPKRDLSVGEKTVDLPERQKTINLPDINNIRRINQNLLTAEVTPMRMQANDKFEPPVQLVSSLPSLPAPAEKKKQSRPKYNMSWNSVRPEKCTGKDEFLLTLDTLNKMLNLFNETGPDKPAKQKKSKKSHLKQRMELQKRINELEKKDVPQTEGKDEAGDKEVKEKESEKKKEESQPEVVTPKINVLEGKPYGQYCCWARSKIEAGKKTIRGHRCPRICRCCCRAELARKYSRPRLVRRITKPSTIIISDDEDDKDVSQTIENVVREARTRIPDDSKNKTDISTQCSLGSKPAFGKVYSSVKPAEERSQSPGNQPGITVIHGQTASTSNRRPVRIRNDLLSTSPTVNATLAPIKHRAHITVDGSQRTVKIHSEPVFINSDGQNKIVYLNGKQQENLTSPIFLGENKILLTDVKFPGTSPSLGLPRIAPAPIVPVVPAVPTVACDTPTVLPPGVQIILPTDGQLTYTIDPGVKLTAEDLATLPVVLEAIRKQLNNGNPLVPAAPSEVVNLTNKVDAPPLTVDPPLAAGDASDDTTACVSNNQDPAVQDEQDKREPNATSDIENATEPNQVENSDDSQIIKSKNSEKAIDDGSDNIQPTDVSEGTSSSNTENVTDANQTENEKAPLLGVSDEPPLQNNTVATGVEEARQDAADSNNVTQNIPENKTESTNSTEQSNRKTLLSDLMEMSGISEEDIRTNVPVINENTTVPQGLVPAFPNPAVVTAAGGTMPDIPELTPITSFSQLKYACEHNGRFFKLDMQLGTLSKIAVCLKKNKPPKYAPLLVKSVVDLTADQDEDKQVEKDLPLDEARLPAHRIKTNKNVITLNEEVLPSSTIKTNRSLLKTNQQQTAESDQVKPLKLFRAIRILSKRNRTQDSPVPLQVTNLRRGVPESVTARVKQKRKQELSKTNIRDNPSISPEISESARDEIETVEEVDESSLDSAELDQYIWKDTEEYLSDIDTGTEYLDSDSSDDEPLANKAKRMRVNEAELEGSGVEIDKEVVARPHKQTSEVQEINVQRLSQQETVQDTQGTNVPMEVNNIAAGANITEDARVTGERHVMEETNIDDENMAEEAGDPETELVGEDEGQFEDELNLLPALQVVEGMDEDGDDEDCILGF